jgi:hypothetical protein
VIFMGRLPEFIWRGWRGVLISWGDGITIGIGNRIGTTPGIIGIYPLVSNIAGNFPELNGGLVRWENHL